MFQEIYIYLPSPNPEQLYRLSDSGAKTYAGCALRFPAAIFTLYTQMRRVFPQTGLRDRQTDVRPMLCAFHYGRSLPSSVWARQTGFFSFQT